MWNVPRNYAAVLGAAAGFLCWQGPQAASAGPAGLSTPSGFLSSSRAAAVRALPGLAATRALRQMKS
ncbi:unnamed protein product [Lampetra planeri]